MKLAYPCAFILLFACLTPAFAKPPCHNPRKAGEHCDAHVQVIAAASPTPVLSVNAHRLIVRYINPLRFRYTIGAVATSIAAPAVPAGIAPSANSAVSIPGTQSRNPPMPTSSAPGVAPPPPPRAADEVQDAFANAVGAAGDASKKLTDNLHALNKLINTLNAEQQCYTDLVARLGAPILTASEQISLRKAAAANASAGSSSCRAPQPVTPWPADSFNEVENDLRDAQTQLTGLFLMSGYKDWASNAANPAAVASVNAAIEKNIILAQGKQNPSAEYLRVLSAVDGWRLRLTEIDERMKTLEAQAQDADHILPADLPGSPFVYASNVDCSNSFYGKGTTLTVTLNATDITAATPTATPLQILTNTCYPPGTVSTGVGFSLVHDRVYAFEPSADPANPANTLSTIQTTTDAAATPLYAVQYNISAKEWLNGNGLHGSIGTAVGSTSGTANFELLAGLSFSFRHRAFFVTPAYQLARRDQLNAGYHIGSVFGNGLTSLPVTTNYKSGLAVTFTFGIGN